jgi:hypothetical protein
MRKSYEEVLWGSPYIARHTGLLMVKASLTASHIQLSARIIETAADIALNIGLPIYTKNVIKRPYLSDFSWRNNAQ